MEDLFIPYKISHSNCNTFKQSKVMVLDSESHEKIRTKLCLEKLYLHYSSWRLKSNPLLRHVKNYDRRYLKKEMVIQLGIQLQSAIIWNKQTGKTKIWFAKLHLHKASWLIRQHYLLQNARFLQILYNICSKYRGLKCFHAGYAVFSYLETKVFELTIYKFLAVCVCSYTGQNN